MTDTPNSGTVSVSRELLSAVHTDLETWLSHSLCECEGGHSCGRTDVERRSRLLRFILSQPAEPPRTGHAIPQWLRDRFDADELAVMQGASASGTFTSMRTAVQAHFEMQREQSESPTCAKSQAGIQLAASLAIPDECPHMIVFDDTEREPMTFAGSGARVAALKTFEQISGSWNAHLFVRVARNSRDDRYPSASVVPAEQQEEPAAWANDQQLLLCSRSRLDIGHSNPLYHNLPRQIAGSALQTEYCNTPLYRRPAAQAVKLPSLVSEFEKWWDEDGQYCRSGGGAYEKTFAYRAYEAALHEVAKLNGIEP